MIFIKIYDAIKTKKYLNLTDFFLIIEMEMYLIVMKVILESKLGFHLFKKNILFVYYLLIHFILFYFTFLNSFLF